MASTKLRIYLKAYDPKLLDQSAKKIAETAKKAGGEKKTELCHTLNGSALALPRIVAALLENNQTPEGIRIPKALVPYTGFEMID